MNDQDKGQFSSDLQLYTDSGLIKPEKVTYKGETQPVEQELETNTKVYTNLENGNEIVTVVSEEILVYDKNENEHGACENTEEYIQICDPNNAFEEVHVTETKEEDVIVNVEEETVLDSKEEEVEVCDKVPNKQNQLKNYSSALLEDWEVDVLQNQEGHSEEVMNEEIAAVSTQENCVVGDSSKVNEDVVEVTPKEITPETKNQNETDVSQVNSKTDILKIPKSITKEEIVKILDETAERVVRPIVAGKDLFFSIELTKRLNQNLGPKTPAKTKEEEKSPGTKNCDNNNSVSDCQKIGESEVVKNEKSDSSKSTTAKENGSDTKAIIKEEESDSKKPPSPTKPAKKATGKRFKLIDKELERKLALRQLREEFPSTRKRLRMSKKINQVPFLASTEVQKALTLPEVTTALKPVPPKRRPCYLPENISKIDEAEKPGRGKKSKTTDGPLRDLNEKSDVDMDLTSPKSVSVVKTYSVKRKSTDTENEIKSTIAAVNRALSESAEEGSELKPKKQKTGNEETNKVKNKVLVKIKKKLKNEVGSDKKRNTELEKLLGDEGAVRMLYDTQHVEAKANAAKKSKIRTTVGLKKDLVLKKKLVKNAVMRLSGLGNEVISLRGKGRFVKKTPNKPKEEEEPLFASTPNIVLYKPKKKQRAEASRILYRHSSSESFDSTDGYGKTTFEEDSLVSSKIEPVVNGEKEENSSAEPLKGKSKVEASGRKSKKLKNLKGVSQKKKMEREGKAGKAKASKETSTDSGSVSELKLNLSNVPVRKSSRPRVVSKKYSIWSSTSMDSLSVESLGFKKQKKASLEIAKKLNCKQINILQYNRLVKVVLTPSSVLKNSLNCEVLQELKQVFDYLAKDDSCTAVLLTSLGKTFCQGIDINQIVSFKNTEKKNGIPKLIAAVREFVQRLSVFSKPVIAGVQGAAVGLGVTILPFCDLVLSSDKASYFTPYAKIGQAPEGAPTQTFPRISRHLVSELLFRGVKMTAAEAFKYGLVTQLIPEERFEEDVMIIAKNLANQSSQAMQSIKFLSRHVDEEEIKEVLQAESKFLEEHWSSHDCVENMVKFLNSGELQLKQIDNT